MKYVVNIQEHEQTIKPYDIDEAFKRGYEMSEARYMVEGNTLSLYRKALGEVLNMSDTDRKKVTGYVSIDAIIADINPQSLIDDVWVYNREREANGEHI